MTYEEENNQLINSVLDRTFFKDFQGDKTTSLFNGLELQLTSKCNLKCSYCYYSDVSGKGKQLNDPKLNPWSKINHNVFLLFQWLEENKYYPASIDIFSGDTLIHTHGYYAIEKAIEFYAKAGVRGTVSVPSNMTFLKNKVLVDRVEALIQKGEDSGVAVRISASIDGKYADPITREPVANVDPYAYYDDEFYKSVFTFCRKHNFGVHPMMSPENIHVWKKNFDWFQNMFDQFGIPWNSIYMLEVRNDGWTNDRLQAYSEFMEYLLHFAGRRVGNSRIFVDSFITHKSGNSINAMNIFNNLSETGRGIGCSLQTTLFVKMGDLTCNSCHRLSYDALNGFRFKVKDDKITGIEAENIQFYMATLSYHQKSAPYCENCAIKHTCAGGCLGAQFEDVGDAFIPIPSVCALLHEKVKVQYKVFKDMGILEEVLNIHGDKVKQTFLNIGRMING